MQHKMMVQMSEQALMDCSWGYGNNACDGGETFRSYEWIMDNNCIPTEDTYGPYLMQVSGWGSVYLSYSCYKVAFSVEIMWCIIAM